jgi:4-carboxymuconolactone decarboxylase
LNDEEARTRGEEIFVRTMGFLPAAGPGAFYDVTVEHVFGRIWARDDITDRDRRLLAIAVLTTLGETDSLAVHMRRSLDNGDLTEDELQGAVVFLGQYAGWARGSGAFVTLSRVLAERAADAS